MSQHCDNCERLKEAFANILQDNVYMCEKSIKKSRILLETVHHLEPSTIEQMNAEVQKLLERMTINLNDFKERNHEVNNEYKRSVGTKKMKLSNGPKKKLNLSLKKTGTTQETDIDLTTSDVEDDFDSLIDRVDRKARGCEPVKKENKHLNPVKVEQEKIEKIGEKHVIVESIPQATEKVQLNNEEKQDVVLVEDEIPVESNDKGQSSKQDDVKEEVQSNAQEKEEVFLVDENAGENNEDESSDDDSQTMPPIHNFDVQISAELRDDEGIKEELSSTLTTLIVEDTQKVEEKENAEFETSSFDFDDEDLNRKLEKIEAAQEDYKHQAQRDNHELLEMLNKATDNQNYPDYVTTEQEGDEALRLLEEENSLASHSDSEDSTLWRAISANESDSDSDWEPADYPKSPSLSGGEAEGEPQVDLEKFKDVSLKLKLKRLDELDDAEIDRLCDLHNLNKRKCAWVWRQRKPRAKRARLLSGSSSSSSSSSSTVDSSSSSGSTTPDLPLQDIEDRLPSPTDGRDENALADECFDKLDSDNTDSSSSDSETDIEKEEAKKARPAKEKANDDDDGEDENEEKENEKPFEMTEKKRRGSWQDELLLKGRLWSDSEDEFESHKEKPKLPNPPSTSFETTVISDSASDSDDDVTFVQDYVDESGRGRRNIRAILDDDELNVMTQRAKNEEDERIQRLEEHSKTIESIQSQHEDYVLDVDVKTGQPLIVADANLIKKMKPHQKTGLQFMWEACYESVDMLKRNPGTGCILAHCMGLGKTLQVITLIHTLFTHKVTNTRHVVVVCPLSTVSNWKNEFKMAFNEARTRPDIGLKFLIKQDTHEKARMVMDWYQQGGVIVMGYEAFQNLTRENDSAKYKNKLPSELRKKVQEALINPGPDLIVCDEGHLLKNGNTNRTKSLMRVATKRRIVLTGTPLQNNLIEYYFMVQFVKPHLLGTFSEYKNRFANPIMNGQYDNSTQEDIKLMKKRTHVLTKLLKKTINRIETKVLESYLPEIEDYTIFIKLQPLQVALYKRYIELVRTHLKATGFFQDFRITKYISLHPYTLHRYYVHCKSKKKKVKQKEVILTQEDLDDNANLLRVKDGWYEELFPPDATTNINYSLKMKILMAIINETVKNGEKILIFAHQLPELECVAYFLEEFGTSDYPRWRANYDYYKMDGEVSPELRSQLCEDFNNNPRIKAFLISHGVGGLGLNLTAASRVVLIASNHNPSHDTQSIYRVYRFGQTKKCYVYRLLSVGTMEEKIYHKCVIKLAVAGTVVDKFHFDRHYNKTSDLAQMYEYDFETEQERPIPLVPNDKLLATLLQSSENIFNYHEHKALLENRPEEELNDEDKKLAWDEFQKEEKKEEERREEAARNNGPSIVVNPMSFNARGQLPRGFPPNHAQFRGNFTGNYAMRPNVPNLPQARFSNMNRPQLVGYNRNNTATPPIQNSTLLKLLVPDNRQFNNKAPTNIPAKDTNMTRVQPVLRTNPLARVPNFPNREQPYPVVNLVDEAPSTSEFNYALNKIV